MLGRHCQLLRALLRWSGWGFFCHGYQPRHPSPLLPLPSGLPRIPLYCRCWTNSSFHSSSWVSVGEVLWCPRLWVDRDQCWISSTEPLPQKCFFAHGMAAFFWDAMHFGNCAMSIGLIDPCDRKWLWFVWRNKVFLFCIISFGLAPAPSIFMRVTRKLCLHVMAKGIHQKVYLDDWFVQASSSKACSGQARQVLHLCHGLGPKYTGIPGVNARGSWNQTVWSLQRANYYTMKQDLETMLYKPLCHCGFKVSCAVYRIGWSVAVDPLSATAVPLHLTQFAVPFIQIVTTVCLQGTWFYTIFYDMCNAWYMVLRPWIDLINCSLNQSERLPNLPFDWGKLVYSVANQNTGLMRCALSNLEHPGCAENQALVNHPCSAKYVLLHALVKYTIQLALQNTFSYTRYNCVVWALSFIPNKKKSDLRLLQWFKFLNITFDTEHWLVFPASHHVEHLQSLLSSLLQSGWATARELALLLNHMECFAPLVPLGHLHKFQQLFNDQWSQSS